MKKRPKTNKITSKEKQEVIVNLSQQCLNSVTLLTRTTKLSRATVSKFFNEQKISPENEIKIYDAA